MVTTSGLATRCTACGTIFRVVPDQLRVSEGWVRCGRCTEVFNAAENLVDLDSGAPRRMPDPPANPAPRRAPPATTVTTGRRASTFNDEAEPQPWSSQPQEDEAEVRRRLRNWAESHGAPHSVLEVDVPLDVDAPAPAPPGPERRGPVAIDSRVDSHIDSRNDSRLDPTRNGPPSDSSNPALLDPPFDSRLDEWQGPRPESEPAEIQPTFLRQAERAERWRQPRVRAALALLGLLSGVVLALQVTLVYRDLAAARWPVARPWLEQTCQLLGCTVHAARAIQGLTVDSSGLVRVERSNVYRLQVALRNHTGIEVALPALDLSLTDGQGRLIARRVLQPNELIAETEPGNVDNSTPAAPSTLGAGRTLALQATLQSLGDPIAGYTIELFYP